MTQAAIPTPHPVLTGADPRAPGQPWEQTPVGGSQAEVRLKPQLSPRVRVSKEEQQNLPVQLHNLRLYSRDQCGKPCIYGLSEWATSLPTNETSLALAAVDFGSSYTQELGQIRV